tara:strand:- start:40 stop:264 length:225 start_codon:yes stop_codon:yes gene_type:complete
VAIAIGLVESKGKKEGYRGEGPRTEVLGPHSFVGRPPLSERVGIFSTTLETPHPPRKEDEMYSISTVSKAGPSS